MKSFLQKNDIEMYSAHNSGKSVLAEKLMGTLKNKTYQYMTSVSKNVSIDKLVNKYIVNKYSSNVIV